LFQIQYNQRILALNFYCVVSITHGNDEDTEMTLDVSNPLLETEYFTLTIGDTMVFISQEYHGVSAAAKYPVVGTVKFAAAILNEKAVLFPLKESTRKLQSLLLEERKMLTSFISKLRSNT